MTGHPLPPEVAARMAERVAALRAKRARRRTDREAFAERRAHGLNARWRGQAQNSAQQSQDHRPDEGSQA